MAPRRIVVGCLCALVIFFGCVTQFNSLATVAGFIFAGLAVGLQTILLSMAAYFFIIGRYGVQVGDRMTITGVTGDVVEVDLLRFYLRELAGSGDELAPTGRVAVFNNAVLFQAGTPLYQQMPGSAYTWHEMTLSIHPTSSSGQAGKTILAAVTAIYEQYRESVERQHKDVMAWADIRAGMPKVESRLEFAAGGIQLLVRFPVELDNAVMIDEQVTKTMVRLMAEDEGVKSAVRGEPTIRASVSI
jgi:small-conductance mechanosensitive channel